MQENQLTDALLEIVRAVVAGEEEVDAKWLDKFVRAKNREAHDAQRKVAKRRLMPEYLRLKRERPELLSELSVDAAIDAKIVALLQAKPRRTASGVATITVLTKPWPCSGNCIFCPNDIRMPKSYIHNEPACQRAERWAFDPYMQVKSRLTALYDMGHNIDKIELIVLGGTFSDYARDYQIYFIKELFRACNEFESCIDNLSVGAFPKDSNGEPTGERVQELTALQQKLNSAELTYNEAWELAYSAAEKEACKSQAASMEELQEQHKINTTAKSRVVGLVVETRPDTADADDLLFSRELGCTKIQIGIQTLDDEIARKNNREVKFEQLEKTMNLLRLLGFKSHVHMMANLMGSTPEIDKQVYRELMNHPSFQPDEVKIYPCCLVESAHLTANFETREWQPYSEEELLDIVVSNIIDTPAHTRISRMIRDISTTDIIAGNKKPNLRQLVELRLKAEGKSPVIQEMRFREIATDEIDENDLHLEDVQYETTNTHEHFLQWVTSENRLAGFLRLSIPKLDAPTQAAEGSRADALLKRLQKQAMIREVHVYGKVAEIHKKVDGAQHLGLGIKLVHCAEEIAREAGRDELFVISAIGTQKYYESLGFEIEWPYQVKKLT